MLRATQQQVIQKDSDESSLSSHNSSTEDEAMPLTQEKLKKDAQFIALRKQVNARARAMHRESVQWVKKRKIGDLNEETRPSFKR